MTPGTRTLLRKCLVLGLWAACAGTPDALRAGDFPQYPFSAMDAEMKRSLTRLRFENFSPPYFIAYSLLDFSDTILSARYGTLVQDQTFRNRMAYVELRYGSYGLDNTDENYRGLLESAALENDDDDLRHKLWAMTDLAYKQAVKDYLQKQGKKLSEIEKEKSPDFSQEEPVRKNLTADPGKIDLDAYKRTLRNASAEFKKYGEILESGVTLRHTRKTVHYMNSEGTQLLTPASGNPFFVFVAAKTQAADGMTLEMSRSFSVRSVDTLPGEDKLKETANELANRLLKIRKANLADPYTGPAILDPESTGVLFHEAVGHRLEGERQRDEEEGQTFKGQAGKQIIPPFLSVADDPTLSEYEGQSLNGHYAYDDEGVPAQKASLVENGILKTYLLSRRPIPNFRRSNGHGRAQFGRDPIGRMSNLFVKSTQAFSDEELKAMLLEECAKQNKPYGILIKKTRAGDTFTGRGRYQAFRGTPEEVYLVNAKTGEEVLVRGVEMVGTPLITINKIIATGKKAGVSNAFCGAESGMVPVSTIAPSSLVKEVELQRVREDRQRPPILPPPLYDGK